MATKILEDNTILLQIERPSHDTNKLYASSGTLVSYFAIQPVHDLENSSQNLFRVTSQPGVQVIRQVFSALPRKSKKFSRHEISYTGLSLIVRVYYRFHIRSETTIPILLRRVRKEFLKRRSMTYTILQATGFEVSLVKGKQVGLIHFRGGKVKEGISIFPSQTGSNSKLIDKFFNLKRVPSRFIQDFAVPDLPVKHRVGHRIDNATIPVGFPDLSTGSVLVCGSDKNELITLFQNLILSFSHSRNHHGIFIIDTHNEFNGLIRHFQSLQPIKKGMNFQLFQLGTNMFVNLCDVTIPLSPNGLMRDSEAIAAWKAFLISNILISSLTTSDYLTSRFAIPLESQIKNTAKVQSSFTLNDVKTTIGGFNDSSSEEENSNGDPNPTDSVFADIMAIEHLDGILDQFKSFIEVNYAAFTGHLRNTLFRSDSVTIFQFGAQPPMIKRAVIAFLLQFLSNEANDGCIVFPHADEILSRKTGYGRAETQIPTVLIDSCNAIARNNVFLLGSQSVQALALKVNSFEEIKNQIYLRLVNTQDREIVITQHQLQVRKFTQSSAIERQIMGIMEGEGLLFRRDTSQSTAYHFKMDSTKVPVDLNTVRVPETKLRGAKTFGLTPKKYMSLMKLLKILRAQPIREDSIKDTRQFDPDEEVLLDKLKSLKLYTEESEDGARHWTITAKGNEYYDQQETLISNLPIARNLNEIDQTQQKILDSESFFDRSSSVQKCQEENARIKEMIGKVLNYVYQMSTAVPWDRYAQYTDLKAITGIEGQDFRQLYNIANELCSDLLLDIKKINRKNNREINDQPPILPSTSESSSGKLEQFLPNEQFTKLQSFTKALELKTYPENGVMDIHFGFLKRGKTLKEELNS